MPSLQKLALLAAAASLATAQRPGGGDNPFNGGDDNGGNGNPFNGNGGGFRNFFTSSHTMIAAHAILATLAFGLLFPVGGIIVRLASFRGLWWIHGLFQLIALVLYIAAVALGVHLARELDFLTQPHAIIGLVLLVALLIQPFLGGIHHRLFKKNNRRGFFSYAHIWLGRIAITLGIVNGGLGLQLATRTPFARPSTGAIAAYAVLSVIVWIAYVVSIFVGEKRRNRSAKGRAIDNDYLMTSSAEPPRYSADQRKLGRPPQYA